MAGSPVTEEIPEGDIPFIPDLMKHHMGEFTYLANSSYWWQAEAVTPAGNELVVSVAGPKNDSWANSWVIWEFPAGYIAAHSDRNYHPIGALRRWGDTNNLASSIKLQPFDALMVVVAIFTEEGNNAPQELGDRHHMG